eukprot:gene1-12804_t
MLADVSSDWLLSPASEMKAFNSRFMSEEASPDAIVPSKFQCSSNSGSSNASELIENDFEGDGHCAPQQVETARKKQRHDGTFADRGPFHFMSEVEVTSLQRDSGFNLSLELDRVVSLGSMIIPEWASMDLKDMLLPEYSVELPRSCLGSSHVPNSMFHAYAGALSDPEATQAAAASPGAFANIAYNSHVSAQGYVIPSDLNNTRRKCLSEQIQKLMQLLPTVSPSGPAASLPQAKLKNGLGGLQSALRSAGLISDNKMSGTMRQFEFDTDASLHCSVFSDAAIQNDPFDVEMLMDLDLGMFDAPTRANSLEDVLSSLIDQASAMQQKMIATTKDSPAKASAMQHAMIAATKDTPAPSALATTSRRQMLQAIFAKHQGQAVITPDETSVHLTYQQHAQPHPTVAPHNFAVRPPTYSNNPSFTQAHGRPQAAQPQPNSLSRFQLMAASEPDNLLSFKSTVTTGNFFPIPERPQRLMHAPVLTKQGNPADDFFARGSMSVMKPKPEVNYGNDGKKLMHSNSMDASTISLYTNTSTAPSCSTPAGLGLHMHQQLHKQQQHHLMMLQHQQQGHRHC